MTEAQRPGYRDYVDAARSRGPSEAELARLAARIGVAAPGASASVRPWRWMVGGVVIALLAGGAMLVALRPAASPVTRIDSGRSSEIASAGTSTTAPAIGAPEREADRAEIAPSTGRDPIESAAPLEGPRPRSMRQASGADDLAVAPRRDGTDDSRPRADIDDAQPSADVRGAAHDEIALIDAAEAALEHDPRRTLELTERHARAFPDGTYAQEREVLAVDALARLGRHDAARARADRFRGAHPRSAYVRRIDRIIDVIENDEGARQ
jgi:hypothetical protein